jgi:hypothetical protein
VFFNVAESFWCDNLTKEATMDTATMNVLCFFVIVLVLIRINDYRHERHDRKIAAMMMRGEGPDHYVTYDGRSLVNIRCIMKKMDKMRKSGEL